MEPFKRLAARCVPFNRNNVDTDQIIPARFLKGTVKTGLGKQLFNDWRFDDQGKPVPGFVLNDPRFSEGKILVAPHNFGCGSSREHAPWALKDYGFKAVLAISFADIFKNNALKNGLLPVALPEPVILSLLEAIDRDPSLEVAIDLAAQSVEIPGQGSFPFEIDPFRKKCLIEGLDDIGYTLTHLAEIEAYEAKIEQPAGR